MVELRLQVFSTFSWPLALISSTRFSSSGAQKGPFLTDLLIQFASLLAVAMADDELLGTGLGLTSLVTQSRLAPRSDRTGTTDGGAALAAAVGMVVGVHDGATDGGTPTHVALTASLTDVDVGVVDVADLADAGLAVQLHQTILAAGQTDLGGVALLGHQLSGLTSGTDQLAALAGMELDDADDGAHGDVGQGQAVAGLDVGGGGGARI